MKRETEEAYTYETKCRRCGQITEWYFAKKRLIEWKRFAEMMEDRILAPRLYSCKFCEIVTVQDIISYTPSSHENPELL